MKNVNLFYWIITGLFGAFMVITAIPDILMEAEAVKMIKSLGYPDYFIPYIGWWKVIGGVVILLPVARNVKEWAYAGLFFDLISAFYSAIKTEPFSSMHLIFFVFIGFLFLSYYFWYKKMGWVK